jgi:hypothetical protein
MKNMVKLFGIIVLVAVIGFSIVACDSDNGNDNGIDSKTVDSIRLQGYLTKNTYFVGEIVDLTGLTVEVAYTDDSRYEIITSGYTISADTSTRGGKEVTVTHTASGKKSGHNPYLSYYVHPASCTQEEFYGTWKNYNATASATVSEDKVVIVDPSNIIDGTYTITKWGAVTNSTSLINASFEYEVEITTSSVDTISLHKLFMYRASNDDTFAVYIVGMPHDAYLSGMTKQ